MDYDEQDPEGGEYWYGLGGFLFKGSLIFCAVLIVLGLIADWLGWI